MSARGPSGAGAVMADDRVLPLTRIVSAVIIPVLTAAFVVLFLFPTRTTQLWAWTIDSEMTAMFMGGGYLAGAYFFLRAVRCREWHRIGVGIVAITVFATMLGITTFLHWDRFNHDHVSFWAWLALYVLTPLLLPFLWLRNQRFDPQVGPAGDAAVPQPVRVFMVVVGSALLVLAVAMFVRPTLFLDEWPWRLYPLTCRVLSAFVAFPAVIYLGFAFDRRSSTFLVPVETAILGLTLIGVAAVLAADEFRGNDVLVWGWRLGGVATLVFLVALRTTLGRRRPPTREP